MWLILSAKIIIYHIKVDQDFSVGNLPESHFFLKSGINITPLWHQYKLISKEQASKQGLSIVSDLQKAL